MVFELLDIGKGNARTARDLAQQLNTNRRQISLLVEQERRAGRPICATSNGVNPGYYIPASREEMEIYCKQLHHRAGEIFKTRAACLKALDDLPAERNDSDV